MSDWIISVITICRNAETTIRKTIESVVGQCGVNVDYWIIDGASDDNTMSIVSEYEGQLRYVSEKDLGISDAFNKGIKRAEGEYLLFLNSGDCFADSSILLEAERILKETQKDIFSFNVRMSDGVLWFKDEDEAARKWDLSIIPHQGTFIKKSVFDRLGMYDLSYRIRMDYEFFSRCRVNGCSYGSSLETLSVYEIGGTSYANPYLFSREGLAVRLLYEKELTTGLYDDFLGMISATNGRKTDISDQLVSQAQTKLGELKQRLDKSSSYLSTVTAYAEMLQRKDSLSGKLSQSGIKNVLIYGFGRIFSLVEKDLKNGGIEIAGIIDSKGKKLRADILDWNDHWPDTECILVDIPGENKELIDRIKEKSCMERIISIDELVLS